MIGLGVSLETRGVREGLMDKRTFEQRPNSKGASHQIAGEECFKQREQETQRPLGGTCFTWSGMESRPMGLESSKQENLAEQKDCD